MASIFSKNGKIYVAFMVYDPETGKNKQKKKSTRMKDTPANRKKVEKTIIPRLEREIREGKIKAPQRQIKISELSEEFLKLKKASNARNYTVKEYKQMFDNHILPKFGDRTPISITPDEIEQWQVWLLQEKRLKAKTVKNVRVPFQGLFDLAIKKRLIDENPFDRVFKISVGKTKEDKAAFAKSLRELVKNGAETEEIIKKIESSKTKRQKNPFSEAELKLMFKTAEGFLKNWIEIAFYTAMRPSEQIALKWEQVNFEKKFVLVVGAITGKETEEEQELNKTESSVRVIYLCDQALEAFKRQYKLTGGNKHGTVFLNQYGKPYQSIQVIRDRFFKDLMKKCNIEGKRLYDLRHSFASINLSKNRLPITLISKIMGHSDISTTLKIYSEYVSDSVEDTMELVNSAFKNF